MDYNEMRSMTEEEFKKAKELNQMVNDVAEKVLKQPSPAAEPSCSFCGRVKTELQPGTTLFAAPMRSDSVAICSHCACGVAGCMGAKDDNEARRMLMQMELQSAACIACGALLKKAAELSATAFGDALTLTQAAETMARIARGGQ